MVSHTDPVSIAIGSLFLFILVVFILTWCCRQFSRTKEASLTLIPQPVPNRYINTIDVQTGLPVVVDVTTLGRSRSQGSMGGTPRRTSYPINTHNNVTLYGTMVRDHQPGANVLARTPPPKYSEIFPQ